MTAHSPFGSIPIRCKAKACSSSLSPALQAHKAHSCRWNLYNNAGRQASNNESTRTCGFCQTAAPTFTRAARMAPTTQKERSQSAPFLLRNHFRREHGALFSPSTPCPWLLALHQAFSRRPRLHDDCPHAARLSHNRDRPRTGDGARE